MVDVLTPEQRKKCMSSVRNKNTKIELRVRNALHAAGFRFRIHRKDLPGKPDIVLPRYSTVVFVNGCFWHGHGCKKSKLPATNPEFWKEKIRRNIERDIENISQLKKDGWNCKTIWECNLEPSTLELIASLAKTRSAKKT